MKLGAKALTLAVLATTSVSAYAHEGGSAHASGWEWPPFIIIPLIITMVLYAIGVTRVWGRMGPSRRLRFEITCFAAGWTSLLLALDSPIHEISEQLFWVHMTQHEILML